MFQSRHAQATAPFLKDMDSATLRLEFAVVSRLMALNGEEALALLPYAQTAVALMVHVITLQVNVHANSITHQLSTALY